MISDQEIAKSLIPLKMIWFSMLLSLVIYLIIGIVVAPGIQPLLDEKILGILRIIFYLLAFITLIATRFIRSVILSKKNQTIEPAQVSKQSVFQRYQSATIAIIAISESIGIYGLVLFFLGRNSMDLYLLLIISAAAMVIYRPNKADIINLMR